MKAFKIEKKSELYDVIKSCGNILKRVPFGAKAEMKQIIYEAETRTLYATNGKALLAYMTGEIEEALGSGLKNGFLCLGGPFVVLHELEEEEFPYSLLKMMKSIIDRPEDEQTRYSCEFDRHSSLFTPASGIVMGCAKKGVCVSDLLLSPFNIMGHLFKYMVLRPKSVEPIKFKGDKAIFVVMPMVSSDWEEVGGLDENNH